MRGYTAKTPERVAEARRLRDDGLLFREIAEHFGISITTVRYWLNDPDGSKLRTSRRKYDLTCVSCGGRVDGRSPGKMLNPDEPVCIECAPGYYAIWTREAIICAIQEWADEHGGIPPTATDWYRAHGKHDLRVPAVSNVQRRFGSWSAAIRAAGYEPHLSGPFGGFTVLTVAQREECARRYAAGESSTSIAADIGCSPQIVIKWARKLGVPIRRPFGGKQAA